jgi:4-amino-4-deoxy-L-arabinose transferase-like glycosyltransferase
MSRRNLAVADPEITQTSPVQTPETPRPTRRRRSKRSSRWPWTLGFLAVLSVGATLRFWGLASTPNWQYDECVYTTVAKNVLQHGLLAEHIPYGTPWSPFLFQPPLYLLILARWFSLVGVSVYHARILGVLCSLGTLTSLFLLLRRIHGPAAALFASIPVILDGWLLYAQRVSYIENPLLLLVVVSMLLYQRAVERPTWKRYVAAGVMIGFAAVFKYTAAYTLAAIALCWLIGGHGKTTSPWPRSAHLGSMHDGRDAREEVRDVRRAGHRRARAETTNHRSINRHAGHLLLFGTATLMILAYIGIMLRLFDLPGHDWFIEENLVQVRRVLGDQQSGGTLTSPAAALHLLFAQYRVFVPSFLIAVASFILAIKRLLRCWKSRNWGPLQGNVLLFSWLTAGVVVFGVSSLRFPQYFALILVPMYSFWWTEFWQWRRALKVKLGAILLAALAGVTSFWLRVPTQPGNPFLEASQYAAQSIPKGDVVVTEEPIGDLIPQPYCRVEVPANCEHGVAAYAITWVTYLQSSFVLGGQPFAEIMRGAVPVKSFTGFSGTATVWRLRQ